MIEITLSKRILNPIIKALAFMLCKIDDQEMQKIPFEGPLLVVVNHVNFLEAGVIPPRIHPRTFTVLAKNDAWDNLFIRFLYSIWDFIPLNRDDADIVAMKKGIRVLENKQILGIFPEGTRTKDGVLIQAKQGTAVLATQANTTIIPIACWGYENYLDYFKKLKRVPFNIRVGDPFRVKELDRRTRKLQRQEISDQIMFQLAGLLPEKNRGYYANQNDAKEDLLIFQEGSSSNLAR